MRSKLSFVSDEASVTIPPTGDMQPQLQYVDSDSQNASESLAHGVSSITGDNRPSVSGFKKSINVQEREQFCMEINDIRQQRNDAESRVAELQQQLQLAQLCCTAFDADPSVCFALTGIKHDVFKQVFDFLRNYLPKRVTTKGSLPPADQLLLTLVKLRHNVSFEFLATLKGTPLSTVINYFWKWIDLMHVKLSFLIKWPDRESIHRINPPAFRSRFPRLTSIIDCFEIFVESPKRLLARAKCYSSYKKHCTCKVFIACNALGAITFLSPVWGGRASDVYIVRQSAFITPRYHHPGDQILADRGFTLSEDFAVNCSASLIMPAFTKGKRQLTAQEVEDSRRISTVRIHIERVIGVLKNRYTILKGILPIRTIKRCKDEETTNRFASIDKIVTVCAVLINLGDGIVPSE